MLLRLDFSSDVPIYMQIRNQIVMGIAEGKLQAGEKLPTVRVLAEECGINNMTVSKAYQLLKQEGFIRTDRRSGAVVCERKDAENGPRKETLDGLRLHLSELRLTGIGLDEAMNICKKLYEEGEL